MSDALRQDTSDKVASSLKPDSEKSTLEKGQDSLKSTADSVAGSLQPEGDKSATQKVSDSVSGSGTGSGGQGQSILDQASDTFNSAAKSVQDTLGLGEKK